jgi:hypothetical protein
MLVLHVEDEADEHRRRGEHDEEEENLHCYLLA